MAGVTEIRFFHSFALPSGEQIAGRKSLAGLQAEADYVFQHGVEGRSVLDIGAWDGFFSFEAEKRGASRVLATDYFCWSGPGWGTKDGFDFVHRQIGSKVESLDVDVFDLDPKALGTFVTVLFLGVLYHLTDRFGGLAKVAAMTRDHGVVETASDMRNTSEPVMRYYLGTEPGRDGSNFWAPNVPCLENMLREMKFKRFEHRLNNPAAQRSRLFMHAWRT